MSQNSASPLLFERRVAGSPAVAEQYAGTDGEQDLKAPLMFERRVAASSAVAGQYLGTDTELDQKDAAIEAVPRSR